jgi:hypothetical protein
MEEILSDPKIEIDGEEPPEVDVLVEELTWSKIEGYVRVSQRFLLARVPDTQQWRGIYRHGAGVKTTDDLGTDCQGAVAKFREYLHQPSTPD